MYSKHENDRTVNLQSEKIRLNMILLSQV